MLNWVLKPKVVDWSGGLDSMHQKRLKMDICFEFFDVSTKCFVGRNFRRHGTGLRRSSTNLVVQGLAIDEAYDQS
jgi:hypothetical protein